MAIRELEAPTTKRMRKPRFPYDEAEVSQAIKSLEKGKTPGVGPIEGDDTDKAVREARSRAMSLIAHVKQVNPKLADTLGTKAWSDSDGAFAVVRVR